MDTPPIEPIESGETLSIEVETFQSRITKEVIGENIQFDNGLACSVTAQEDLSAKNSLVFMARAEGNMEIKGSGGMTMVAGKDMQITNGGAQVMVAGAGIELVNSGAQLMVAGGEIKVQKGFVGVAVTNQLSLSEDSKVLLDKPQAILFGAAFGAVFGLVSFLLRKRK